MHLDSILTNLSETFLTTYLRLILVLDSQRIIQKDDRINLEKEREMEEIISY